MPSTAILDVDGTLVDSNFHHAIAWYRAFRQHDVILPMWRIHRHMGMGGEQLVASLAGDEVEEEKGEGIRTAEKPLYLSLVEEVQPLEGARELIEALKARGFTVVLASSANADEVERYLDLVGARDLADGWTTGDDVESTKPQPDLIEAALREAGAASGEEAVLIGDSVWDCQAAGRAGVDSLGVLTGGFAESELREAGARAVFESLPDLREQLDDTPLARPS